MKKLKKAFLLGTMVAAMALTTTGCAEKYFEYAGESRREASEVDKEFAQKVIDSYLNGDIETLKTYVEKDAPVYLMLDALDDENPEGMAAVYQKAYEQTKGGSYSLEIIEVDTDYHIYQIQATINTTNFSNSISQAMLEAAQESGDSFADMPTWLMKGLEGGTPAEYVVELDITNAELHGQNDELFRALTGGFYDYILATMTSGYMENEYGDKTYMVAQYDSVKASLDEYVLPFEGVEYSDEEVAAIVDEYAAEYKNCDGVLATGERIDDGIRFILFIDYNVASEFQLQQHGLLSGTGTGISLAASISDFEESGYKFETTDFGSGVLDK